MQTDFLNQCSASQKDYHASLFRIGNAAFIYHKMAEKISVARLKKYYPEWLEWLPQTVSENMKAEGFEKCKTMFSFTGYVNEREDKSMDEWMKSNLSEEDYKFYQSNSKEAD